MVKLRISKVAKEISKIARKKSLGIKDRDILLKSRDDLNEIIKLFNSTRICDGCGLLTNEETTKVKKNALTVNLCNKCGLLFFQGKLKIKKKSKPKPAKVKKKIAATVRIKKEKPKENQKKPEKKNIKQPAKQVSIFEEKPKNFDVISKNTGIGIVLLKALKKELSELMVSLDDNEMIQYLRTELKDRKGDSKLKDFKDSQILKAVKEIKGRR